MATNTGEPGVAATYPTEATVLHPHPKSKPSTVQRFSSPKIEFSFHYDQNSWQDLICVLGVNGYQLMGLLSVQLCRQQYYVVIRSIKSTPITSESTSVQLPFAHEVCVSWGIFSIQQVQSFARGWHGDTSALQVLKFTLSDFRKYVQHKGMNYMLANLQINRFYWKDESHQSRKTSTEVICSPDSKNSFRFLHPQIFVQILIVLTELQVALQCSCWGVMQPESWGQVFLHLL